MSSKQNKTTHERIIANYYEITSSVSHGQNDINYERRTSGMLLGLGDWLDVKGLDVLDLGCGVGELCWLAHKGGAKTVGGVNLSMGELEMAKQHVQADFIHENALTYLSERDDESLDRIFAMNILEHLSKDDLVKMLEYAHRCLRPGGKFIAMVPNATSTFGAMTRYWDITHQLSFTPSSVRQLMRLTEFDNVEFREWGPRIHGITSGIRYLLWQGCRAIIWARLMIELASGKGGIYTSDMLFRMTKS